MEDTGWNINPYKIPVTAVGNSMQQEPNIRFRYITNHQQAVNGNFY
jgi:hypothetical protein